uniref:fibrous sheath-interacting protein 2-like isoform X2 n=1 Tax=Myxine glutinosa TaxID=7769 RepID=UPI00358DF3CA
MATRARRNVATGGPQRTHKETKNILPKIAKQSLDPKPPPGRPTMSRAGLSQKLYQPSATMNLEDPNVHFLRPDYHCLHDEHLTKYFQNPSRRKRLIKNGELTHDNQVTCSLKELNKYNQYLDESKLFNVRALGMEKVQKIERTPGGNKEEKKNILPKIAKQSLDPKPPPGRPTMSRAGLSQKLYQPSATMNLEDPNVHFLRPDYHCLHDEHLTKYFQNPSRRKRLIKNGELTHDNQVTCSLKELNKYNQYLDESKLFNVRALGMEKVQKIERTPGGIKKEKSDFSKCENALLLRDKQKGLLRKHFHDNKNIKNDEEKELEDYLKARLKKEKMNILPKITKQSLDPKPPPGTESRAGLSQNKEKSDFSKCKNALLLRDKQKGLLRKHFHDNKNMKNDAEKELEDYLKARLKETTFSPLDHLKFARLPLIPLSKEADSSDKKVHI